MICPGCQADIEPIVSMGNTGIVKVCPVAGCNQVIDSLAQPAPVYPQPQPQPGEGIATKRRTASKPAPFDVIKEAKRRRRYVSAEVKRLRKELKVAEREEAQLKRLLAAAEEKPEAKIRAIRSAAS